MKSYVTQKTANRLLLHLKLVNHLQRCSVLFRMMFSDVPEVDQPSTIATPKVPISLRGEVLQQLFNEKQIRVVHWRLRNGRMRDDQNVVLLNFIPQAFSERVIREEFLMIFALVHAAQTEADTIDVIRVMAEDENGTPQMSLEARVGKLYCVFAREN